MVERVENPFVLGVRAGEILVRPEVTGGRQDFMIAFGHVLFLEDQEWRQHNLFARVVAEHLELSKMKQLLLNKISET